MKLNRTLAILLILALLAGLVPAALAATTPSTDTYCNSTMSGQHSWGDWTTVSAPTCAKAGSRTRTCGRCGYTQTETVKKTGHKWGSWQTTKEATCTRQGQQTRKCKVCGKTDTRETDRKPHTWGEWTVITEPTDFTTGTRVHTCAVCGTERSDEFYPDPTYKRGDSGDGVKDLQEKLNAAGYDCGKADGIFGKKTEAAVKALEEAHGFTADGIAWPGVQRWLVSLSVYSGIQSPPNFMNIDLNDSISLEDLQNALKIVVQPKDSVLPQGGGTCAISVGVEGGKPPLTYSLYQEEALVCTQVDANSFVVHQPGRYFIRVEDADGQWVESDEVRVREPDLRIVDYTRNAVMNDMTLEKFGYPGRYLTVMAQGGKKPYQYSWYRNGVYQGTDKKFRRYVDKPGTYICRVTDANGAKVNTGKITVLYRGSRPLIVQQPGTVNLPAHAKSAVLTCRAVSHTGKDSGLIYIWQKKRGGSWISVSMGRILKRTGSNISGVYRCVVTDTKTGKRRFSEKGMIRVRLSIGPVKQQNAALNRVRLSFRCDGGCAPYRVTVQMKAYYTGYNAATHRWTGNYHLKTVAKYTINSAAGTFLCHAAVPKKYRTIVNGKHVETNAEYVITVTSNATGQKASRPYTVKGK